MIVIPAGLMKQITDAAERAYPEECCGLLAGIEEPSGTTRITRVAASDNVAEGARRHDRFEVDPKVRFDLMRQLADGPERMVGHYHSHPDHPARPSEQDRKMAFEPDLVWLIVAVDKGRAAETTAHELDPAGRRFKERPLRILATPPEIP